MARKILLGIGVAVGVALAALIAVYFALNSKSVQNSLMARATQLLSDKLQTTVAVDSVSVGLLTQDVKLYGVCVEDREHRKMLQVGQLVADVDLLRLRNNEIRVNRLALHDVTALIVKTPEDSVANYQFLLDALHHDNDTTESGKKFALDMKKLSAENVAVTYNDNSLAISDLRYTLRGGSKHILRAENVAATLGSGFSLAVAAAHYEQEGENTRAFRLEQAEAAWQHTNRKGARTDYHASVGTLRYSGDDGNTPTLHADSLHLRSDNHRPRKNTGKPNRGFFDAGHLDITAALTLAVDHAQADSLHATLTHCTARDDISGIDLRDIRCTIAANRQGIRFGNAVIRQTDTELRFARGDLYFPDKQRGTTLLYSTSTITGKAILKNISRAFSPALSQFVMPLSLSVSLNGNDDGMTFSNVVVSTDDKRLTVSAHGSVSGLRQHDSHAVKVHFDVSHMTTTGPIADNIIQQFPVKRFMMKQLHALGAIHYTGNFDVIWRRQLFHGTMRTAVGNIAFDLDFDHNSKYLTGTLRTDSLAAGVALDMPDIGPVAANAEFKVDISKERAAALRGQKGGKLPIGEAKAHVSRCSYKFLKTNDIDLTVSSNGTVAEGNVFAPNKFIDLNCSFSFTNTDNLKAMKVKPSMKFHKARKSDK